MIWLTDTNDNKCSVEYFGTEQAAQTALESLKECKNCINCYDCYGCSDCSRCSGCSGCSDCSGCSRCSGCFGCSGCSGCFGCFGCSDCSGCFGCFGCFDLQNAKSVVQDKPLFPDVPVVEDLHRKIYAAVSQPNALDMSTWHTCETPSATRSPTASDLVGRTVLAGDMAAS